MYIGTCPCAWQRAPKMLVISQGGRALGASVILTLDLWPQLPAQSSWHFCKSLGDRRAFCSNVVTLCGPWMAMGWVQVTRKTTLRSEALNFQPQPPLSWEGKQVVNRAHDRSCLGEEASAQPPKERIRASWLADRWGAGEGHPEETLELHVPYYSPPSTV